jgi:hypothetical protein
MEQEDKAWRSVAMQLNNFHAGVLDSCPPMPKALNNEKENGLTTHFQRYYLDGISQEQRQFLDMYCTPSSTDDIDAKLIGVVESLQTKVSGQISSQRLLLVNLCADYTPCDYQVDVLQENLTAQLHDQRNAEKLGKRILENISVLLDKRGGLYSEISEANCCPLPDTVEVLRVLANDDQD